MTEKIDLVPLRREDKTLTMTKITLYVYPHIVLPNYVR